MSLDGVGANLGILSRPPIAAGRRANIEPENYIAPEQLLDYVAELYNMRNQVVKAIEKHDWAARTAGLPIRSASALGLIEALFPKIREIEQAAQQAWQGELAASGVKGHDLRAVVGRAARADSIAISTLLNSDDLPINTTELLALAEVLDGAIVSDVQSGGAEYAARFFASLDDHTLEKLVRLLNANTGALASKSTKTDAAKRALSKLRFNMATVLGSPDVVRDFPDFAMLVGRTPPDIMSVLLQRSGGGCCVPVPSSLSVALLARRFLPDPRGMGMVGAEAGADAVPTLRGTIIAMLQADANRGGDALNRYFASPEDSPDANKAAANRLLCLIAPNSSHFTYAKIFQASQTDEIAAAKLIKSYFVGAFDQRTKAQTLRAFETLELAVASVSKLDSLSNHMANSLALGFAGAMTNTMTLPDLLKSCATSSGAEPGSLDYVGDRGFAPNQTDLRRFITRLCESETAVKTIAAGIGPMIHTLASIRNALPTGAAIEDGTGFIYGAMIRKFDNDEQARRTFLSNFSAGLTLAFAIGGGAVSGPAGGMTLGGLGSGVLQFIADRIDAKVNTQGLPTEPAELKDYLRTTYVMFAFKWLVGTTKVRVIKDIGELEYTGERPNVVIVNGVLWITNLARMRRVEAERALGVLRRASLQTESGVLSPDEKAISDFVSFGILNSQTTRQGK